MIDDLMDEPEYDMPRCLRCGKAFTPKPTKLTTTPLTLCCDTCSMRNVIDGLDMPTPPALLDPYSKYPTLTETEFKAKINKIE